MGRSVDGKSGGREERIGGGREGGESEGGEEEDEERNLKSEIESVSTTDTVA